MSRILLRLAHDPAVKLHGRSVLRFGFLLAVCLIVVPADAQIAVKGRTIHTMTGPPIRDGVVIIRDGKIAAVGPAASTTIPGGFRTLEAAVVTPGLIDAHATVGLTGQFNYDHDQDQLERSAPLQPELRAVDAYNPHERLVDWVRGFGVTTVHTGHAPGELISGQTMIVKLHGNTVEDGLMVETAAIAATLASQGLRRGDKPPGTRAKAVAMLRGALLEAQAYLRKQERPESADSDDKKDPPRRDLRNEALARVLKGELPLLVTAHRSQDIMSVLRLAAEFDIRVWLDGAAESYLLLDEIKAAGVPVVLHPPMERPTGDQENQSWETARRLRDAGIPFALQSGYEGYVPKVRVVLFEAAILAANGLSFEQALATITIDAARLLGIDGRVGSIEIGKDGDLALYNGDPFEYTTHCVGVIIDGELVSEEPR